jgi:hypothetical protein
MALRGGGCFTPAAFLFTVGFLLILGGSMGEAPRYVWYGLLGLAGSVLLLGTALYFRWQGWE